MFSEKQFQVKEKSEHRIVGSYVSINLYGTQKYSMPDIIRQKLKRLFLSVPNLKSFRNCYYAVATGLY